MAKFWYILKNKKDNMSVVLGPKNTVVFSARPIGTTEAFEEENPILDNLVKDGRLEKLTDAEKKVRSKAPVKKAVVEDKAAADKKAAEDKAAAEDKKSEKSDKSKK